MRPLRHVALLAGMVLASASCAKVLGIKDAELYEPTELELAISAYAEVDCAKLESCSPGTLSLSHGSVERCVERTELNVKWWMLLPGIGWNLSTLADCAAATAASTCATYLHGPELPACNVPGTLAIGQPCNRNSQCVSEFCAYSGACGKCAAAPAEGAACVDGSCGNRHECAENDTCQRERGLGEDCTGALPCRGILSCYLNRCALPETTPGTACDSSVNHYCDWTQSLTCASSTSTCVEVTSYDEADASCGVSTSTRTATLCARGTCGSAGKCVERAVEGQACDEDGDTYCEWPAWCSNGTCKLPGNGGYCE